MTTKATDLLTRERIRELTTPSDARGVVSVASDWFVIALCFLASWAVPHPLVWLAALFVLGSRQLALAVLMHECAHHSLFRTRAVNDEVGTWLCAAPIWADVRRYREHHARHHGHTGTDDDPDLGLIAPFPTTRASLLRKFLRDLSGMAGLRRVVGLLAMDFGFLSYSASTQVERLPPAPWTTRLGIAIPALAPVVLTNAALLAVLSVLHPALYLLWVGAWLTTYSFFLRVRAIAEHACTASSADLLQNTRTTTPDPITAWLFAPHQVHYHLEHHLLPSVPHYRLAALHADLVALDVFDANNRSSSYADVMRRVTT